MMDIEKKAGARSSRKLSLRESARRVDLPSSFRGTQAKTNPFLPLHSLLDVLCCRVVVGVAPYLHLPFLLVDPNVVDFHRRWKLELVPHDLQSDGECDDQSARMRSSAIDVSEQLRLQPNHTFTYF